MDPSHEYPPTEIEGLSGKKARNHFLMIYTVAIAATVLSVWDYSTMWECANVCHSGVGCKSTSDICLVDHSTWEGELGGLHWLNRFMHLTVGIKGMEGRDQLGYGMLLITQEVFVIGRQFPQVKEMVVDMTHCTGTTGTCYSTPIRVMASGKKRYKIKVKISDAEVFSPSGNPHGLNTSFAPNDVGLMLEFQSGIYTLFDFLMRLLLLVGTSLAYYTYRKRAWSVHRLTPEQKWIAPLLAVLAVYLNPTALVATMGDFDSETTRNVLEFIEFHAATYFTITVQVMYICLMGSLKEPLSTFQKAVWGMWAALMVAADITVAIIDTGPSTDYTATFVGWVLRARVTHLGVWYIVLYVSGMLLTLAWLVAAITKTKKLRNWLRKAPYGPTRRAQLVSRSLLFIVSSYVLSRSACLLLYWLLLGKYQPAYRSADESGTVILSSVLTYSLVYQFSPGAERNPELCPPLPNDPSWEHPRWRRCKWKEAWYQWLQDHGGALFYFIHDEEQEEFSILQRAKPKNIILLSAADGWPVRSEPSVGDTSKIISYLHTGAEVEALEMSNDWCQLPDGNFICLKETGVEGVWKEPSNLGFSMATHSPIQMRARENRLFFCVETAARFVDLCYSVYYPPGKEDFRDALLIKNSFGWSLTIEHCSINIISLASSIAMVSTGLVHQPQPSKDLTPNTTPAGTPRNSPSLPAAVPIMETTNLNRQNLRLIDVIELAGTRVVIATPVSGERSIFVSFRGSDIRYSKVNLISDLRFARRVWRTMEEVTQGTGPCGKPLLHRGFMDMWEKSRGGHALKGPLQNIPLRDAVLHAIDAAIRSFGPGADVKINVTGHSLGAALACILAYTMKKRRGLECTVYTFGQPKLGNAAFKRSYEAAVPNTFRVVFEYDPVVHVSGTFYNFHVGREVCIDRKGNLLVEPTWVEKAFQPTKTMGVKDMGGHGLDSYTKALNRVFLRAGSCKRCLYPKNINEKEAASTNNSSESDLCGNDRASGIVPDEDDDLHEMVSLSNDADDKALLP